MEPRATDQWFHSKVFNILTSFLWSIRVQTLENCCRFVFYNSIYSFWRPFRLQFLGKSCAKKRKTNCATITSLPLSVLLSTIALDQSPREKSLGYCNIWLGIKRYHLYQKYHHHPMSLILSFFFLLLRRRTAHDNSVVRGKEWGRTKLWHRRAPWSDRKNPGWVVESNVRMIKIALTG